jgi:hypothetical protein
MNFPTRKESLTVIALLAVWLVVTGTCIGFRPEHPLMALLIAGLFFATKGSRQLVVALLPFILFAVSYDWMNLLPNYKVNPVDTQGLYEAEKSLFGITTTDGVLTPNEFFARHTSTWMDFMAGVFYLCWVPVPILFGLWLFFARQRREYLHFAWVFLLVNLIGFAGYYIHPAAPPWYVASYGFEVNFGAPGEVAGLGAFDEMTGLTVFHGLYARNANVFAAVPSLHSAYMLIAFIYSLRARTSWACRVLFAIIACGIWLTAVYTSHHYLIDVLLGITCTLVGVAVFECGLMRWKPFARWMDRYTAYIE